jgi:hypothetical protein
MITLGFNKKNPRNFSTPFNQQSQGQPTKVGPLCWTTLEAKGVKPDFNDGSTSYSMKQGGEDKCWRCDGPHKNKVRSEWWCMRIKWHVLEWKN